MIIPQKPAAGLGQVADGMVAKENPIRAENDRDGRGSAIAILGLGPRPGIHRSGVDEVAFKEAESNFCDVSGSELSSKAAPSPKNEILDQNKRRTPGVNISV